VEYYYFQGSSRRINGPTLPDVKIDDNIVSRQLVQVIEGVIYSGEPIDKAV
jgi:hypothetical protein